MERIQLEQELMQFLKNNILAEDVNLQPESNLSQIGIDSFSIVEIILFVERKFGISIPEHQLLPEHFQSVEAITTLLLEQKA
ncbi:MAG: acyl carrier protein [Chitinophagaceae bacterium]|nr:acyl carrier protein [Chitinophagaceae bacterium]